MTIDFTKPVQTRDGRKVRILCTDRQGEKPVVGLAAERDGSDSIFAWSADGRHLHGCPNLDLVQAPETWEVTGWVNVYQDGEGSPSFGSIWNTRQDADGSSSIDGVRIACVPVTLRGVVGEGLE